MKNNNVKKISRNIAKYNDVRILRFHFGTLELKNKGGKNE